MFQTGRMLFERIENRVLVGIIAFVSIMVLVGWVAINENARMASFTRQYEARSIERGAELFAASCSTCHGTDGRGSGRAPGLNNPQFFGHDFIENTRKELDTLNKQLTDLGTEKTNLTTEVGNLDAELTAEGLTDERKAEIDARKVAIADRLAQIEVELVEPTRLERIAALEAEKQTFADSVVAAIDLGYDVDNPSRTGILKWGSTQESLILTTLIHGRPNSASYWNGEGMPAWSQRAGGSMRDDQLEDITAYIMNWDKGDAWTIEDLLSVKQFAKVPGEGGAAATAPAIGTDAVAAFTQVSALVGDPVRGERLYANREAPQAGGSRPGCSGCHTGAAASAPQFEGTYERIVNDRLTLPQFAGYTVEQYIVESIVNPAAFTAPDASGVMPVTFGEGLSAQDVADLVAYIKTTDPNYVAP